MRWAAGRSSGGSLQCRSQKSTWRIVVGGVVHEQVTAAMRNSSRPLDTFAVPGLCVQLTLLVRFCQFKLMCRFSRRGAAGSSGSRVPGLPGSGGAAGRLEARKREYDPGDASDLSHAQGLCMACALPGRSHRGVRSATMPRMPPLLLVSCSVALVCPPSSVRGFTCEPGQRIQLERHAAIGNLCTGGMSWKAYCAARRFACDGAED